MKKFVTLFALLGVMALAACGPAPAPDPAILTATAVAAQPVATAVPPTAVPASGSSTSGQTAAQPAAPAEDEKITLEFLRQGSGDTAVDGDWVVLHLVGTLADGTALFDTYEMDQPIVYPFGDEFMLEGVNQAVAQMRVGDKAIATIPPSLGLGPQGGGMIPPNATLIFEMEFIEIPRVQVIELEPGSGDFPQQGDVLVVHYVGTLEDGTEFDSSYSRAQPFEFPLGFGQVIPGWEIGMAQMRPGGKAQLIIPSVLAYGSQELPGIPANSTLIFEVELLEVK